MKYRLILIFLTLTYVGAANASALPDFTFDKKITTTLQRHINRQAEKEVEAKTYTLETINDFRCAQQQKYLPFLRKIVEVDLTFDKKTKKNIQKTITSLVKVLMASGELNQEGAQDFAKAEEERLLKSTEKLNSGKKERLQQKRESSTQYAKRLQQKRENYKKIKENPTQHEKCLQQMRGNYKKIKENPAQYTKRLQQKREYQKEYYKKIQEENPAQYAKRLQQIREYYSRNKAKRARQAIQEGNIQALQDGQQRLQRLMDPATPSTPFVAEILAGFRDRPDESITDLVDATPGTPYHILFNSLYETDDDVSDLDETDIETVEGIDAEEVVTGAVGKKPRQGGLLPSAKQSKSNVFDTIH